MTADELLPCHVWAAMRAIIPEPPAGPYGNRRRTGRPLDTSQDRSVIAALVAHELLDTSRGVYPRGRIIPALQGEAGANPSRQHCDVQLQAELSCPDACHER